MDDREQQRKIRHRLAVLERSGDEHPSEQDGAGASWDLVCAALRLTGRACTSRWVRSGRSWQLGG